VRAKNRTPTPTQPASNHNTNSSNTQAVRRQVGWWTTHNSSTSHPTRTRNYRPTIPRSGCMTRDTAMRRRARPRLSAGECRVPGKDRLLRPQGMARVRRIMGTISSRMKGISPVACHRLCRRIQLGRWDRVLSRIRMFLSRRGMSLGHRCAVDFGSCMSG
jgi:hypothetical protein